MICSIEMGPPGQKMLLRSIRIDKSEISYVKWLLEAHDGMATPTTRGGSGDVLDLMVAPDFAADFEAFLAALGEEIRCEEVEAPSVAPLGDRPWPEPSSM